MNLDGKLVQLAFWFKWQPSQLVDLNLEDVDYWFSLLEEYLSNQID